MNEKIKSRISALRRLMEEENIAMYIVPTSDFHDSEYVGDYFRLREYLSGFTGSNGTLVVTSTWAGLWTDGRYFLQAADQLSGTDIELMKMGEEGVPTLTEYVQNNLPAQSVLGFDGRVFSKDLGTRLEAAAREAGGTINYSMTLADSLWTDRPSLSENDVFSLSEEYTGCSTLSKLEEIRKIMKQNGCSCHILTSLDDIAWILNMRGSDVTCNPVFLSYMIITENDVKLFASLRAFAPHAEYLESIGCKLFPYNDIYTYVRNIEHGTYILADDSRLNYSLFMLLNDRCELTFAQNPSVMLKACKNETEMSNLRSCNIVDGVAMVRFLHWLDDNIGKIHITEISAAEKLEEFRREGKDYIGLSFETISGYNAHGAIIHYEPTEETDATVEPHGLLLVDSGAQYLGGTTDITRTIAVGPLTDEMKHHYTKVLRANLALSAARFKEGCCGANLDILARAPFWDECEDYNHGTGHGVGYFLNVHEGPQSFHYNSARKSTLTPLKEGMVITDEPGIYIEGKYGIRIENDLLCHKYRKTEYGQFMNFEVLTLCPIDLRPVNFDEMTPGEIGILRSYHDYVVEKLSPMLSDSDREWLKNAVK